MALNGLSNENFKRIITIARIINDSDLNNLLQRSMWGDDETNEDEIHEWTTSKITSLLKNNEHFRQGVVNLFFEGAANQALIEIIRPFELKKLSILKLKFDVDSMIDTLVRYKEKGSAQAKGPNNAENVIRGILQELEVDYTSGDLPLLLKNDPDEKRTMDFIIPNIDKPRVIIESSFLSTTSSGQGDKAKTEINVRKLIKKHYPGALFWGFVDGIGWYVRKKDLGRMVSAYDDVFTFREDELARFRERLTEVLDT